LRSNQREQLIKLGLGCSAWHVLWLLVELRQYRATLTGAQEVLRHIKWRDTARWRRLSACFVLALLAPQVKSRNFSVKTGCIPRGMCASSYEKRSK
jgi:hypothetical protein